jgi:CheY-like chemotaxis protein
MRLHNHEPADPPPESDEAASRKPRPRPGVLVVDDEHFVRHMVQLSLERDGFDVWLASNGREAIRLYREHRDRIAVVLLDVRMPNPDGPQTLAVLRKLNPAVQVCFMSGDAGAYEPEELRQRGAACVIAKPFRLEDLAHVLRLVTQGEPADPLPAVGARRL